MASHQVTISWDTSPQNFPNGTVIGNYLVTIGGGNLPAPLTQQVANSPAVFPAIDAEQATDPDFTFSIQLQDQSGVALGAPDTGTFSIVEPPVVGDVPVNATVTIQ